MSYHRSGPFAALNAIALAFAASLSAPTTASAHDGHIYSGPSVTLGQGTARAWVMVDRNHKPKAIGVNFSEKALQTVDASSHGEHLTLLFPSQIAGTPFKHVFFNWNPHGHPPAHVWDKPHFDVHFYMTSPADREAIAESDPAFAQKAENSPPAHYIPADHVKEPGAVPAMGAHWADKTTPELHGQAFTHTMIYGAWDGKVTFIEPMIAKTVFERRQTVVADIKQPPAVAITGLYPTRYRIEFDAAAGEYRIALDNMVFRESAEGEIGRQASK